MNIIGTDEAGYGPNLGPLVVSATLWTANENDLAGLAEIGIDDSKKIYHAGGPLAPLETVVLATLRSVGITPKTDVELYDYAQDDEFYSEKILATNGSGSTRRAEVPDRLGPRSKSRLRRVPSDFTFSEPDIPLPVEADEKRIEEVAGKFQSVSKRCGVRLERIRFRTVFPAEFNATLSHVESKGALLSDATLRLVVGLMEECPKDDVLILCDKHGGRNRYLDLLHGFFPDDMIWTDHESRASSVYRFKRGKRSVEIRFQMKGESMLPVALASMVSKYLRETAMLRLNRFWQSRIPNLKPTAGYPEDARRFKRDITDVQTALNIADHALWREK